AHQAILATLLASRGFEGPSRVFEGHAGFNESILHDSVDVHRLTRREDRFTILDVTTLLLPVEGRLQAQTEALLDLVEHHPSLTPERIGRIRIVTSPRVLAAMADTTHRYPKNKETADSSAYYVAALAVVDRRIDFGVDQFTPERLGDQRLRRIID